MDVVLGVGKFVQFSLILLQLSDLLLDLLQQLLSLTDGHLFLGFDELSHLKALQLDRPNQFGEDGVALLGRCPSSTLEEDTEQHTAGVTQESVSLSFGSFKGDKMVNYELALTVREKMACLSS